MKLKNLAALIIRFVGALIMVGGLEALVAMAAAKNFIPAVIEGLASFGIGYCLIFYSKKLATLFCKGLDDDDVS